jgi:protoporphyrinogen oxidase
MADLDTKDGVRFVVLGSGMAACGAAHRLNAEGIRPTLYDKNPYHGGHTASFRHEDGFVFDIGPHISYTKVSRIQQLFADSVDDEYETLQLRINNYWRGHWPIHPVQLHLHGLPEDVVIKVITDFVAEQHAAERVISNYEDWLVASFGRTFAELFPMQYTRKYHLTDAANLTIDWLGPRFYRPNLEEVLRGALSADAPKIHPYIDHFRYPTRGGFGSYLRKLVRAGDLVLRHRVVAIDPKAKELAFADGTRASYDLLISSIPLPEIVPMIAGAPQDVLDAASRLACSTCVLVNIGVDRADLSDTHITYFYDEDVSFTRISYPHMLSPNNAPPGAGSIQAELYFSHKYRPLTVSPESLIATVIADLKRCTILRDDDQILHRSAVLAPYANVIFDHDRVAALEIVHGFMNDVDIGHCGRYGDWAYLWTDESFMSGEHAAEAALGALCSR